MRPAYKQMTVAAASGAPVPSTALRGTRTSLNRGRSPLVASLLSLLELALYRVEPLLEAPIHRAYR